MRRFGSGAVRVFVPTGAGEDERLFEALSDLPITLITDGADWNDDLTPWAAKNIFRGGKDFGGGASKYLERISAELDGERRWVAGYSLAGLFAVYAAGKGAFEAAASVSGSMWYENFLPWLEDAPYVPKRAYFSVGDREKLGRNRAFQTIEDCTLRASEILRGRGAESSFELNRGGHFDDPVGRLARGIRWLFKKYEEEGL